MRTSTKGLLATLIIASTLTLGACQGQKQTKAEAEQPKVSQTTQNKATPVKATSQDETVTPDGWVVIDNETAIPVADKLGEHLAQARKDYLKGDNQAAAEQMRQGSTFLNKQSARTLSPRETGLSQGDGVQGEVNHHNLDSQYI